MPAPEIIHQLVKTFDQNRAAYRSGKYNEAQLRQQFLDKFFTALGWDVGNTHGYPPENAEVVIEDSLEVEGTSKAPDYCFRLGHDRKFFVEAKKPAIDIKYDIHPAYQLRRYAWNAHLPLSILTDFEELSIYNTKAKPNPNDSPATCRDKYYHYTEYIEKWDEIAAIFSREAVWNGSFDKFAVESKGKKGTTEVDDDILATISEWRKTLAGNIALRNKPLIHDEAQLNYAVQMTIDRILFLRICEDRGIEPEDQLKSLAAAPAIYPRLVELFRRADTKYNSGLFHFSAEKHETSPADTFTPSLSIDDKVLKEIIKDIYYPCPYIFKEIPVEILGQVYEQFLGKVIRLTPAGLAKVEEKPEVRKAGGVYYTPTYIVDYIVENTVGELLKGKTPEQASALKIVDPACGSGSFLLGAFEYLMDWHYQYYTTHDPESWAKKKNPPIYPLGGGWRLTTSEKKRILTNNLHGVDIDAQAVEVTKLSLLLKVLEEETGQLTLGFERVLPDLGKNIQCGNSLIGWDYFEGQLTIDEEEKKRVNPFNWQTAFPQVFAQGGFDAVIGNPPWGIDFSKKDETYIRTHFSTAKNSSLDSYVVFIETGNSQLKTQGLLGFITPDTFLRKKELLSLRTFLLNETSIKEFVETGPVFSQVRDTWCLVMIISKGHKENNRIAHHQISRFITSTEERLRIFAKKEWANENFVNQKVWENNPNLIIGYLQTEFNQKLIKKLELWPSLEALSGQYKISRGEEGSKFAIKPDTSGNYFMVIPQNIERYQVDIGVRVNSKELTPTKVKSIYEHPKIWIIRIQKMRWKQRIVCSFDDRRNSAAMKTLQSIVSTDDDEDSLKFLASILSSKLINFWCINYLADDMNQSYLSRIPIRTIDKEKQSEINQFNKMIMLVSHMHALHKRTPATPQEQEQLAREIAATDHQIDQLVYQLYGLTDEEIAIVENS